MNSLTRDAILGLNDIKVKQLDIPEWKGSIYIRQLTRAEQDEYLKRQYGGWKMKQDNRAKQQEISQVEIYGHDAYLCVSGICDENGKSIFTRNDIEELKKKSGSVIGRIASEILKFSAISDEVNLEQEVKN